MLGKKSFSCFPPLYKGIPEYFVRILKVAREMGLRKVGSVSPDGTKVKANTG
jgi:hypothetical protein